MTNATHATEEDRDDRDDGGARAVERVARILSEVLGQAPPGHLETIIRDALGTGRFVDDLAELFSLGPEQITAKLEHAGFRPAPRSGSPTAEPGSGWRCSAVPPADPELHIAAAGPGFDGQFPDPVGMAAALDREWASAQVRVRESDPFLSFYRTGVRDYLESYRRSVSPRIHAFVNERFGESKLRYLVTIGIGANEQFWHFPQRWYRRRGVDPAWLVVDNPKELRRIPPDATRENTLVLMSSRSGKTQETVKCDEFLDPAVPRIVLANSGPLAELAERNQALRLDLPERIPGRFSKNLSPILLAPLDILGLPFEEYWQRIAETIDRWNLLDPSSPPSALARYLRAAQLLHGANHVYLGCNDELLLASCDEFLQFWNEGVNKGSDFAMSRYFGLPRDSHLNIEGILANHETKAGVFLLRRGTAGAEQEHPLTTEIRPVNERHAGLTIDDVDYVLARANAEHFGTKMPTVTIEVAEPGLLTSATLSQLWMDTVYVYSAMIGVNPGSNPEVRHVRDRSETLLAEYARARSRPPR